MRALRPAGRPCAALGAACALALAVLAASPASAAAHYVSPAGTATWEASTDIAAPCSLAVANQRARPGDTVYLRGGTYTTAIEPAASGAAADARICFAAYGEEPVVIRGAAHAIHLDGKSYISVRGLACRDCRQFLVIRNGHHNDIGYCSFDRNLTEETWMGSWVHDSSTYNRIHHCAFSRFGWVRVRDGQDMGAVLDIGFDASTTDASDHNVVEACAFFAGGHHLLQICGRQNVVRGNYLHNEAWMPCRAAGRCGNRCAMIIGPRAEQNLFEGNRFAYAGKPPDDNGADGLAVRSPRNIVRRNLCYGNGAAGMALASMTVSIPVHNYIYQNTLFRNGYCSAIDSFWTGGISFGNWGNGPMPGNIILGNIIAASAGGASITGYGDAGPQAIAGNWRDGGDPRFVDGRDPADLADPSLPDLRLRADSPCIDQGPFLTTVASPAGAGTTLVVADAGFFWDGWGIPGEVGDTIQLAGTSARARLLRVDYDTQTLTLDRPLRWSAGQGVALAYEGAAPDLGAWEFGRDGQR